jgi:hypothetical protein
VSWGNSDQKREGEGGDQGFDHFTGAHSEKS